MSPGSLSHTANAVGAAPVDTIANARDGVLTAELLESDNRYFELGAEARQLSGGRLVWVPQCAAIAPGCLVLHLEQPRNLEVATRWIADFEAAIREVGGRLFRLYLQAPAPVLVTALLRAGWGQRAEVAFLTPPGLAPRSTAVVLHPVTTRAEWERKCQMDAESSVGPDGYASDGALWHELLRLKWETGHLPFYFIERDGQMCGTVGSMEMGHVLRLKNLVIRPACRNMGIGRETVLALWREALRAGKHALGVFAVADEIGFRTYRSAGLFTTEAQYEWTKDLD